MQREGRQSQYCLHNLNLTILIRFSKILLTYDSNIHSNIPCTSLFEINTTVIYSSVTIPYIIKNQMGCRFVLILEITAIVKHALISPVFALFWELVSGVKPERKVLLSYIKSDVVNMGHVQYIPSGAHQKKYVIEYKIFLLFV